MNKKQRPDMKTFIAIIVGVIALLAIGSAGLFYLGCKIFTLV